MHIRHGVDDQVEASGHRRHLRGIGGDDDVVCAEPARVGLFAGRAAE